MPSTFQHNHSKGSIKAISQTLSICQRLRRRLRVVKWNGAPLKVLFSSRSFRRRFTDKSWRSSWTTSVIDSSTLAFSRKNETKSWRSRLLIRSLCLRRHTFFSLMFHTEKSIDKQKTTSECQVDEISSQIQWTTGEEASPECIASPNTESIPLHW
jgi:hypothetical protein